MPIQLTWQPNNISQISNSPRFGLEITGEDATLAAVTDGRVKLLELQDTGAHKGQAEAAAPRLIATFHGKFHSKASAPRATRITFEIFTGPGTFAPHVQDVEGFDPECIFGVDVLILTFVNREFVIWLPFNVDSRSEGGFLEIQAVAEIGSGSSVTELGHSMVLNLPIERSHAVDTTSNGPNNRPLDYSGRLIGNMILSHRDFIISGQVPNPRLSSATQIVLEAAFVPVPPGGTAPPFSPYPAGSMRIILLTDLLSDLVPSDSFLTSAIRGAIVPAQVRSASVTRFKSAIKQGVLDVFSDAGFTGVQVLWNDEAAANLLFTAFKRAFMFQTVGGQFWRLLNPATPFNTSFWNFFVGSSDSIQTAGQDEDSQVIQPPTTIARRQVFLPCPIPIGSGNKNLSRVIQIATAVFKDLLTTSSGVTRTFKNIGEFNDAVDKVAGKMIILISHEVAHSLGLMHHCRVESSGNFDETDGSPVLSIMSSGVESGGFGVGLRFASQAKVIWAAAFGVSPTFSDTFLKNKTWSAAEVFTVGWSDRTSRFIRAHGEVSIARPQLASSGVPPFALAPPRAQRGTFIP
jgi:hypothetical protein